MGALLCVIVKEFLQLRQDRKMIPVLLVGPLAQLLALGYAANLDVRNVPLVLVDQDRSSASRDLVERFTGSGYFDLVGTEDTAAAVEPWSVRGRAQVGLVIAPRYGVDLHAGRPVSVQVLADGTDANSAVVGMGYASRIVAGWGPSGCRSGSFPFRREPGWPASTWCRGSGTTPTSRAAGSTSQPCWPWC